MQGRAAETIDSAINKQDITLWSEVIERAISTVYNFAHKAFLQVLPTASNLHQWKKLKDPQCTLCKKGLPQTNKHVLSNCSSPAALQRYTERHNAILQHVVRWLKSVTSASQKVFTDIGDEHNNSTKYLFHTYRPDIAICNDSEVKVLELTICHETNLNNSKTYKLNKYRELASCLTPEATGKQVTCHTIEVSTLGFISPCDEYIDANRLPRMQKELKKAIIRDVLNY